MRATTACEQRASWAGDMEEMESLPPQKSRGNQNALVMQLGERILVQDFDRQVPISNAIATENHCIRRNKELCGAEHFAILRNTPR
jgi:hypothetical protein